MGFPSKGSQVSEQSTNSFLIRGFGQVCSMSGHQDILAFRVAAFIFCQKHNNVNKGTKRKYPYYSLGEIWLQWRQSQTDSWILGNDQILHFHIYLKPHGKCESQHITPGCHYTDSEQRVGHQLSSLGRQYGTVERDLNVTCLGLKLRSITYNLCELGTLVFII